MRAFFLALALALAILIGLYCYSGFLSRQSENMLSLIDTLAREAESGNWENTEHAFETLRDTWEKTSPRLALFTDHSLLDEIILTTAAAGGYVKYRELPELMAEIETLRSLISHIPKREQLSLYNIF